MILVVGAIHQQLRGTVQDGDDNIDLSVIVQIAESGPAMSGWEREAGAGCRAHILEGEIAFVAEEAVGERKGPMRQLHGIIKDVGVCGENVFIPVVVEIKDSRAPGGETTGHACNSRCAGDIMELAAAEVAI